MGCQPAQRVTHAQIASEMVWLLPPGVFAHAARAGVIHHDFVTLERMLPGVHFATRKLGSDEWELIGTCADGSTVLWRVGE